MRKFVRGLGLEPIEYEFIKLIHPLFNGLTRKEACKILGWSVPVGVRIWKSLLERYPELISSMIKWTNPNEVTRRHLHRPKKFGNLDDPYFGEDKIVRRF